MQFPKKIAAALCTAGAVLIGSTGAVTAIVALAPAAHAASALTSPQTTALRDGQTIPVTGTGFEANTNVFIAQCSNLTGACDTENFVIAPTNASGSFEAPFKVRTGDLGGEPCPGVGDAPCYLFATANPEAPTDAAVLSLDFAPVVTVSPSTKVVSGQTLAVTGRGFAPSSTAFISQCQKPANPATCDTEGFVMAPTDGQGSFTASIVVKRGKVGESGTCAAGGTCFIAVTTDPIENDADQGTAEPFTFAGGLKTPSITARYKRVPGKIFARVTSGGSAIAGLQVRLQRRESGVWKRAGSGVTSAQGRFTSKKLSRSGKYRVITLSKGTYRPTTSAVVIVKR